jgi:hypothetical protein
MATPRAPRKATGGVDIQLEEFETDLRAVLSFQLLANINYGFWAEIGDLSNQDNQMIEEVIDGCFLDMKHRYQNALAVVNLLEHCKILIQNSVWVAMNVPMPTIARRLWADSHIEAVINNVLTVYNRVIYAPLRTEMIMANHNAEVLQRTWRRCITDPSHPACRRRLQFEYESSLRDLNAI